MALIRIGESLHCHIPSVKESAKRWLTGDELGREAGRRHLHGLVERQVAAGADYLDINVDDFLLTGGIGHEGSRELLGFMLDLTVHYGRGTPPCIDSSDPAILEWGLERYRTLAPDGAKPLVNSVTATRLDILHLRRNFPFSVVGMLLERVGDSGSFTDIAGPEAYLETARFLFTKAREAGFSPSEFFLDPTVGPLGADMVGYTRRTFEGIRSIRDDDQMQGVHVTIGLSNCSDGLPRRLAINRAYLRIAMEYGVDAAILDVANVSGQDLVDGRILSLIRQVIKGDSDENLTLLVDFVQGQPRPHTAKSKDPFPDLFRAGLESSSGPVYMLEAAPAEDNLDQILAMAEAAVDTPFTFSVTDTPGGNRVPGPDIIGLELARILNRQPIVNLSCKSDDRNGLMQRILGMHQRGLRNFFAVTGDYPWQGKANFDLDSVTLLLAMDCLRRGLEFPSLAPRANGPLEGLYTGAAVSPFKYMEADLWGQYLKLWKKRSVGADYFITQLGYDVRKFHELKLYMQRAGMGEVPLIGMVYVLSPQLVRVLSRAHVAGVVIPPDLQKKYRGKLLPKDEADRVKAMGFVELAEYQHTVAIRRAALLADILVRGLEYNGIDFAGVTSIDDALEILAMLEDLRQRDWRESYEEFRAGTDKRPMQLAPEGGFYLFPEGDDGLLADAPPLREADRSGYYHTSRRMSRLHETFFERDKNLWGFTKWAAGGRANGFKLRLVTLAEQAIKTAALSCEMCGDCRIADLHYLCPEPTGGCAKRLVNGPCGGADERGMCEVFPDRRCYWGKVMEAELCSGGTENLTKIHVPKDPRLQHTSSWRNEVLGIVSPPLDLGAPPDGDSP